MCSANGLVIMVVVVVVVDTPISVNTGVYRHEEGIHSVFPIEAYPSKRDRLIATPGRMT